ncbi:rRNA N6-adenosine-methyltransferase ZCCHC4 [Uranotaenia lowii]|uniref:rRNA N6-adenosine-methyltransferase ZCCHC4 n=1 Tax=Uranotaenia lowii TaxID=190385 RepID=UPI00247ADB2F|nr:rRNA N6-adenosine-methyltransferase ZCCHC4 [Uranotaenia lowii]
MTTLKLILENIEEHPRCEHGPTILFHRTDEKGNTLEKYYSCSASRSGKCSIKIAVNSSSVRSQAKSDPIKQPGTFKKYEEIRKAEPEAKFFCFNCQALSLKSDLDNHSGHTVRTNLKKTDILQPTQFLTPLSENGDEAQYFFSEKTLECFVKLFNELGITKVICMGAPRLHEHLLTKTNTDSLMLDIDKRFYYFYDCNKFLRYNMFNNYFFDGFEAKETFLGFLRNSGLIDKICIFTDPPFGCRTELLARSINEINRMYNKTNCVTQHVLPTFWIFPYFMENYVRTEMPSMEMIDYHVEYTNHGTYHNKEKGLKHGSPVRFFTNILQELIRLPKDQGYVYCKQCRRSVHKTNKHCKICNSCTSKNGSTYKHCTKCNWCVKPNYIHCQKCGRCTQRQDHECNIYSAQLSCRICSKKGHTERKCSFWKLHNVKIHNGGCLVCGSSKHTLCECSKRKQILKEFCFLGKIYNEMNDGVSQTMI